MDCVQNYLKSYELGKNKDSFYSAVRVAAEHGMYHKNLSMYMRLQSYSSIS